MNTNEGINYCSNMNTPNAYVGKVTTLNKLVDGMRLSFKVNGASTGNVTINLNGLGAKKAIKGSDNSTQVNTGELVDGGTYDAVYNSTADSGSGAWIVMNL